MTEPEHTAFTRRLPIGERLPLPEFVTWDIFPFEGDLRTRPLEPPVLPEPPRRGEDGPDGCEACALGDDEYIWTDERWRVRTFEPRSGLPMRLVLEPRAHVDSADLPPDLAGEFGIVLQRIERAILSLGGVARVHMSRWGDGGAHLHWWLFARPEGMMQLRGTFLAVWDDILPPLPEDEWRANLVKVAAALATNGGTAHV